MAAKEFRTKLDDGFIALPFDARQEFGRARPPVKVSINGYTYRSTVCVYGGNYFIPVRRSNREAAGISPGVAVRVTVALDKEPRTVTPPADLQAALTESRLQVEWEKLSFTTKKEFADVLLAAKKPETRSRRIERVLEEIRAKKKQ